MKTESHASVVKSEVRRGALARHTAIRLDAGRTLLVVGGIGLPRSWSISVAAVVEGFTKALGESNEHGSALLAAAIDGAHRSLVKRADALVEQIVPDAALVACIVEHGEAHIASVGACRAYLHRAGEAKRLTPRDEQSEGLFEAEVTRATTALEPEDVLLLGSTSAFSVDSVAKVAQVLAADPKSAAPVLASLLTEPAARAGMGAAAIAVRVK